MCVVLLREVMTALKVVVGDPDQLDFRVRPQIADITFRVQVGEAHDSQSQRHSTSNLMRADGASRLGGPDRGESQLERHEAIVRRDARRRAMRQRRVELLKLGGVRRLGQRWRARQYSGVSALCCMAVTRTGTALSTG